jgi:hypothetical protein
LNYVDKSGYIRAERRLTGFARVLAPDPIDLLVMRNWESEQDPAMQAEHFAGISLATDE